MSLFHTIGHSHREITALLRLLQWHRVNVLVDVRRHPASRRHPQFNRDTFAQSLAEEGIKYIHERDLGARRSARQDSVNTGWEDESFRGFADYMATQPFREALFRLEQYARTGAPAILCAEALPGHCHRQIIADALLARGHQVRHILAHRLTPFARIGEDGQVTYPAAQGALNLEGECEA